MNKIIGKFSIFLRCVSKVNNWYIIPLAYYKIIKSKYFVLSLKNGLKVKMRTNSTDLQAFVNVWILEEYKEEMLEIGKNDIVIDVGAHIGLFTLYASQFCRDGSIYAFEPFKENLDLFRKNMQINKLMNINILNYAVAGKKEKIRIYKNNKDNAAHSMYGSGDNFFEIEAVTIGDVIDTHHITKCDLLKIDCEGAEYEIIKSIPREYFPKIEKICLEYHLADSKPYLLNELKETLRISNYKLTDRSSFDGMGILFASK